MKRKQFSAARGVVIALLLCLAWILVAGAAEMTKSDSIPFQKTNWSNTLTVDKFDPALGQLTQVQIVATGQVSGTAKYESLDSGSATITLNLKADITIQRPDNSTIVQVFPLVSVTETAAAFDGAIDFAGPSGSTFDGLSGSNVNTQTLTSPGDLALFTGPGTISLPVTAAGSSSGSGAGNLLTLFNTDAAASVVVKYTYINTDYGDAPDPNYPTLAASNGAVHTLVPGMHLGAHMDVEADGQPNATATGDDVAGSPDDEDGVVFTTSLVGGVNGAVNVTASAPGLLQGWIDFNGNGSWADAGEQIFLNQSLTAGVNNLTFSTPAGAPLGTTFARFRFSSAQNLPFTGPAPDGEVEDYQVKIQASVLVCKEDAAGNKLPGWTVHLEGQSQTTGGNGCTVFLVDEPGQVTITETLQAGWTQIAPAGGKFQPNIDVSREFGPYTFKNAQNLDYGDAPDPSYPTLLASNGARHMPAGPMLGQFRDLEADGQPNATATGDDVAGSPDDEDGVVFGGPLTAGQNASVTVTASAPAKLDAWVDFNQDGDWNDPGEQIFTNQAVVAGPNALSFPVPAAVTPGASFARFRLSTAGGLAPTGLAQDGEVEDHQVELQAGGAPYQITKTLMTAEPVRVNNLAIFSITITNTGSLTITTLPLTDTFDSQYLGFSSSYPIHDSSGAGFVHWNDLTSTPNGFGQDLGPGQSFQILVRMVAKQDTSGIQQAPCNVLDKTCNVATVSGAQADDGPGGSPPQTLPDLSAHDAAQILVSTAVAVADRTVRYQGTAVQLAWRTVSEADMVRYYIWRGEAGQEPVLLTPEGILAQKPGQPESAAYTFTDASVEPLVAYRYLLNVENMEGVQTQTVLGDVYTGHRLFLPRIGR